MINEYTLYLDESKSVDNIFVIGGFACHISRENEIEEKLAALKNKVWKDSKNKDSKVFHATDYIKRYPQAFVDLIKIVREVDGNIFATVIKLDELVELFGTSFTKNEKINFALVDNPFNIALEKVIENYTHYLFYRNAYGKTIYEARNAEGQQWNVSPDFLLKKDYLRIISNNKGITYINDEALKLCNTHFSVRKKKEDLAGLQIADNIAYIIARSMSHSLKEDNTIEKIFDEIFDLAYNGNFKREKKDLRHFYGIRILPEMFRTIPMERKSREQIKYYNHMIKALEKQIKVLEDPNSKNNFIQGEIQE
ncbi:MAG: DUF3800 domain-containing protein [Lachnospiraceae bacterium]|nr:DUF3800 domain-containing protein [Lachnospiraceae bacterium]